MSIRVTSFEGHTFRLVADNNQVSERRKYLRISIILVACAVLLGIVANAAYTIELAPGFQFSGYMQNRGYNGDGINTTYKPERVALSTTATLPNDSLIYAEVNYHAWASDRPFYLESAYYDRPLGDGRLRVGKGRRLTFGIVPTFTNRKTSNYGIVSEAATQDRVEAVQYTVKKGDIDWGIDIQRANRLGTRAIGEIPDEADRNASHTVRHLCMREIRGAPSHELVLSTRVGKSWKNGLNAGLSLSAAKLDDRDLVALTTSSSNNSLTPGATPSLLPAGTTNDNKLILGLDFTLKRPSGIVLQGEAFDFNVSKLNYNAWYLLLGLERPNGWKFYTRYAEQNMDVAPTTNPLSWDVQQTVFSIVQPLNKNMWLQYEYEINSEDTDTGAKVDNNIFFTEMYFRF